MKDQTGIERKVLFYAWCTRSACLWEGKAYDSADSAEYELACHEVDVHGGRVRKLVRTEETGRCMICGRFTGSGGTCSRHRAL